MIATVDVDEQAVLAASTFNVGDVVDVKHPIYNGKGKIFKHGWLENISPRKEGEPSHYLMWLVDPEPHDDDWPGVIDFLDTQYDVSERNKVIKKAE